MASEAALVERHFPHARVAVTGARHEAARAMAAVLAADCDTLLSIGTAGGLTPSAAAGSVWIGKAVQTTAGQRFEADPGLLEYLSARLCNEAIPLGIVAGVDKAVAGKAGKVALGASGAEIVDMESHHLAAAAVAAGRPFAVLRSVLDGPEMTIPAFAAQAIDAQGRPRLAPVLRGLALNPLALPALMALGRANSAAHAALDEALARIAAPTG